MRQTAGTRRSPSEMPNRNVQASRARPLVLKGIALSMLTGRDLPFQTTSYRARIFLL
jgi:hypothetical protein